MKIIKLFALSLITSTGAMALEISLSDAAWNYNYTNGGHTLGVSAGTLTTTGGADVNRGVWQYFNNQSLNDGDSISVSLNVNLTGSAVSQGRGFAVGLFNSFNTEQLGAIGGLGSANMGDDAGYFQSIGTGGNTTSRVESWYGQASYRSAPFGSETGTTTIDGSVASTINDTTSHAVTLEILRDGNGYVITSTLDGSSLYTNIAVSTLAGTVGYAGTDDFTFDMIAFGIKNAGQQLQISDINLQYTAAIPEPSTYALWAGLAMLAIVGIRRHTKNKS